MRYKSQSEALSICVGLVYRSFLLSGWFSFFLACRWEGWDIFLAAVWAGRCEEKRTGALCMPDLTPLASALDFTSAFSLLAVLELRVSLVQFLQTVNL